MNVKVLHRKRTVLTVLLILLLSVAGMTNVFAHDFEVDNLLYTITSTNPPTVSLDGHVDGTSASDELLIPESVENDGITYAVTAIGDNAFADCTDMYGDIVIPNSVVTIGNHAFNNAGFDGNLVIGESVTNIGSYAFANLGSTSGNLHIPNAVTIIGDYAFYQSYFEGSFALSTSIISIGAYAFYNLSLLSVSPLALPNTLTYVGDYAFYHCSSMTGRLTLSTNLNSIGTHAFDGCGFTQLNFGSTTSSQLQTIGDYAFYNCTSMTGNLSFPINLQSVGEYAFSGCQFNGNLNLRNVQAVGAYSFSNVPFNSNGLTIPATLTDIGEGAFYGCFQGGTLTISANLTSIPHYAFYQCGFTGDLVIHENVGIIGKAAFASCGFSSIHYNAIDCESIGYDDNSNQYYFAFSNNTSLQQIVIGDNVTQIPAYTFGNHGASNCNLVIGGSVTNIKEGAFYNNSEAPGLVGDLVIPSSVTQIGNNSFYGCRGLTTVSLPEGLSRISGGTFTNCTGLTSITLPESLTFLNGFNGCTGLTSITIPSAVESIGYTAFQNCTSLEEVNFNAVNCNTVNYEGNNEHWLSGCTALTSLNIGDEVQILPEYAFFGCSNLTGNLVIPASVTSIGDYAFSNNNFTSLTCFAETPPTLGEYVFNGMNQSTIVIVPCGFEQAYSSISWGGFNNFNGLCSGVVTVAASPVEGGTVTGGGTFEGGQSCTVTATANTGYVFANWTANGAIASTNSEYTFPVYGDMTLVAHFVTEGDIVFADANVKAICVEHWDANADGELSYVEAASVTDLSNYFQYSSITSFNELQYFIGLSAIGGGAFYYCSSLTSIVLPESILSIGESAFNNCNGLTGELVIPNSVVAIGYGAFRDCSGFTGSLTIGENVTSIGDYAFRDCSGFTGELVIPNSVVAIGYEAFSDCSGFTGSLTIGENVAFIGGYAFEDCSGFTALYCIAPTPPTLNNNAFYGMNQDLPVYVPCDAVETYQTAAWGGFSNFNGVCGGVIVVEANTAEGGTTTGAGTYEAGQYCTVTATANAGYAFAYWTINGAIVSTNSEYTFPVYEDMTLVAHFVIDGNIVFADANVKAICVEHWDTNGDGELSYVEAASVTDLNSYFRYNSDLTSFDELQYFIGLSAIGENAFYSCYGLTSIVLPGSLTTIGNYAFCSCGALTSIVLPSSLTSIGDYAFNNCYGLTSIVLPGSLTSIGASAFSACSSIQSITSLAVIPPTIMDAFTFSGCYDKPLFIPCGTLEAYQSAAIWSNFTNVQAELYDFFVQDGLRYEIISTNPPQVTLTGFAEGTNSAENLVIPATVHSDCSGNDYAVSAIAANAFKNCAGLTGDLVLPNTLVTIGDFAFWNCTGLDGELTIPESVTRIGMRGFVNCRFTVIHYNAINCQSMGWDENHESLYYVFWLNENLQEIIIGENVTQIPDYAFGARNSQNCQLTFLGNAVTRIGSYAFYHDEADDLGLVGNLAIPSSVTEIGKCAFNGCNGLTGDLIISENMNTIGAHAFAKCGFSSIHYNATNCESIGYDSDNGYWSFAFWDNTNMEEIVIGDNVTQIPTFAFANIDTQYLVDLGNGLTTINNWAFNYSNAPTSSGVKGVLVIPASVIHLGSGAFYGCSGLTEIWSKNASAPWIQNGNVFYDVDNSIPVHVPCGSLSNYQSASYWSDFSNYSENPYVLVVRSNNEYLGNASVTQYGLCSNNESVVHADANLGAAFVNWTTLDGTIVSNNADYAFALTNDITLVANFMQLEGHHNFVGAGDWNDVNNWSPNELPTETSTVGIFGYAHLYDNATVASATVYNDYFITIHSGAALTVTGMLTTSDDSRLYLQEGGQLYHANDGVNAELVRTITPYNTGEADGWHLIASPLEEEVGVNEVENLMANEYDLYYYDEPTHYWMNQEYGSNGFNALENAKGYLYGNNGIVSYDTETQLGEYYYSTTSTIPMNTDYLHSISEQLFLASELTAAGVDTNPIKSISWYSNSNGELNGISIWMANVDDAALTSTSHNTSSMQLVFTGGSTTNYNGWTEFEFNHGRFIWDGTSNVLVCVQRNGTSTQSISWRRTDNLGFTAANYRYNGNSSYDMSSNTYSTYTYDYRPITRFKMENTGFPFETQVGEGENTSGDLPMHSYWKYSISEQLFKADELNDAGTGRVINSLSWYATAVGEVPSQRYISIWMANVSDTYMTTTSHNTSDMTLVYYGSFTPQMGWNEFAFNRNDFVWDGTSNVLVCVQRNNGAYKNGLEWQTHTTNFNASGYLYNDDNIYNMSSNTYTVNVTTERTNTLFKCEARNATIAFTGEVNNGASSVNVPLSYTETAGNLKGFNLVGNPYAHNVTSYGSVNVVNGCYVINEAKDDLIVSEISEANPLKPLEGFFVKATANEASITFNPQRSATMDKSSSIRVEVSKDNKLLDRLIVKGFEGQSLEKFNLNKQRTQLFAVQDQKEVAIVPCEGNEQSFCFKASKDGNYTIKVDTEALEFTYLHLIDNLTGNDVNLLVEPSYTFEAKTTDYSSRFKLVFATGSSIDPESDSFAFINNSGNLTIYGIEDEVTLQVIDVLGHVLSSERFSGSYEKKLIAAPGVYMLRLINGDNVRTQKVVIR